MTTELYATAGLTVEGRRWYEKQLLLRAVPKFSYNKYTFKKNIPRHGGHNIQFREFTRILPAAAVTSDPTALTEGTPPGETNATFREVNLTISQYGQFAFLSDVAITQSQDDLIREYSANFGDSMGDGIDRLARTAFAAITTVQFASTAASRGAVGSGMTLTAAEVREAVRTLRRNNAPEISGSGYVAIIHPDTWFDFIGDSDVVNAYQNAGPRGESNPLFTGDLFRWMGVTFDVTSNAAFIQAISANNSPGLSGAAVYQTVVFGDQAVGATTLSAHSMSLHFKPLGAGGTQDPLDQFATVGWKAAYVAGVLNNAFGVVIEHTTSTSQNGAQPV